MKKIFYTLLFLTAGCAYHNPLDSANFRFQTLSVPPYILSSWYRIEKQGAPLTVYVEKEVLDDETRDSAVRDTSDNVAYLARPCQYLQTGHCGQGLTLDEQRPILQKGIQQLQKKAHTETIWVKGLS